MKGPGPWSQTLARGVGAGMKGKFLIIIDMPVGDNKGLKLTMTIMKTLQKVYTNPWGQQNERLIGMA